MQNICNQLGDIIFHEMHLFINACHLLCPVLQQGMCKHVVLKYSNLLPVSLGHGVLVVCKILFFFCFCVYLKMIRICWARLCILSTEQTFSTYEVPDIVQSKWETQMTKKNKCTFTLVYNFTYRKLLQKYTHENRMQACSFAALSLMP